MPAVDRMRDASELELIALDLLSDHLSQTSRSVLMMLRSEPFNDPTWIVIAAIAIGCPAVAEAIMQAVGAPLPKLISFRQHPVAAPGRRKGNLAVAKAFFHLLPLGFE